MVPMAVVFAGSMVFIPNGRRRRFAYGEGLCEPVVVTRTEVWMDDKRIKITYRRYNSSSKYWTSGYVYRRIVADKDNTYWIAGVYSIPGSLAYDSVIRAMASVASANENLRRITNIA